MMLLLGVTLTTLAILFMLAILALTAAGQVRHPGLVGLALAAVLVLGMLLMSE